MLLGRGSFSVVYAGTAAEDATSQVAIRFAYGTTRPKHHTWIPDLAQMFMSGEGCVLPLLQFLPETRVFPYSCLITIMPRVKAVSFRRLVAQATLDDTRRYMRALLRSLAVCAELGIVHRDVKPKNFLWDADRRCGYLTDFGLSETTASLEERARRTERAARLQAHPLNWGGARSGGPAAAHAVSVPLAGSASDRSGARASRAAACWPSGSKRVRDGVATCAALSGPALLPPQRAAADTGGRRWEIPSPPPSAAACVRRSFGVHTTAAANERDAHSGDGSKLAAERHARPAQSVQRAAAAGTSPTAPPPYRYSRVICADQPGAGGPCVSAAHRRITLWPHAALERLPAAKGDRAGTPGFRAPEVLLASPHQGTAVDVWSAGIVLACLLSRRYPLLPGRDDLEHIACLLALLGPELLAGADAMGRHLFVHAGAVALPAQGEALASAGGSGSLSGAAAHATAQAPPSYVPVLQMPANAVAGLSSIMPQARISEAGFGDALDLLVSGGGGSSPRRQSPRAHAPRSGPVPLAGAPPDV